MTALDRLAPYGRLKLQSGVDIAVSVLLTVLIWPFPVARAMLSVAAHFGGLLVLLLVVQFAYYFAGAFVWQRTLGMRLAGVRLSGSTGGAPSWWQSFRWASTGPFEAYRLLLLPSAEERATTFAERISTTRVIECD